MKKLDILVVAVVVVVLLVVLNRARDLSCKSSVSDRYKNIYSAYPKISDWSISTVNNCNEQCYNIYDRKARVNCVETCAYWSIPYLYHRASDKYGSKKNQEAANQCLLSCKTTEGGKECIDCCTKTGRPC